jgi:hypothetical protein
MFRPLPNRAKPTSSTSPETSVTNNPRHARVRAPLAPFALRLTALIGAMLLWVPSYSAAQLLPCTANVPGCQNAPFFYLVPNPNFQTGVRSADCGSDVTGCLAAGFIGTTGRDPGGLITAELQREIVGFPIPSPSGGFTFTFDRRTRTFNRSTNSFGPTYGERATTQGRRQLSIGASYQLHTYSNVVGADTVTAAVSYLFGTNVLWTQRTALKLTRHVFDVHAAYGITDAIDIAFQLPVALTNLAGTFESGEPNRTPVLTVHFSGRGAGIADTVAQIKAAVGSAASRFGVVARLDFPTGDPTELTGLGYGRTKLSAVWSGLSQAAIQPRVDFGAILPWTPELIDFDINDAPFNLKPKQLELVVGSDVVVSPRLTAAIDILARREFNSAVVRFDRVRPAIVTGILIDGTVRCCVNSEGAYFPLATDVTKGIVAVGAKYNIHGRKLVSVDIVMPFGPYAIRPRPTLTVGLSAGF